MGNYSELLKDPRWQKKRLKILERDGWKCQCCLNTEKTLHVHHTRYVGKNPWECPNEYLLTLCHECHENEEKLKSQDLYSLIDSYGITRHQLVLLIKHIRYRMDSVEENSPFWVFHYEVLGRLVEDDELDAFNEYLKNG